MLLTRNRNFFLPDNSRDGRGPRRRGFRLRERLRPRDDLRQPLHLHRPEAAHSAQWRLPTAAALRPPKRTVRPATH